MRTIFKLDLSKVDKNKIENRTYTNKEGVEVTEKNWSFEAVELKERTFIKEGDSWTMYKTHFLCLPKENKDDKTIYCGSGIQFESKGNAVDF